MVLPRTGLITGLAAAWRRVSQLGQGRRGLCHGRIGTDALQGRSRLDSSAHAMQHHGSQRDHGHDIPPAIKKVTTSQPATTAGRTGSECLHVNQALSYHTQAGVVLIYGGLPPPVSPYFSISAKKEPAPPRFARQGTRPKGSRYSRKKNRPSPKTSARRKSKSCRFFPSPEYQAPWHFL